LTRLRNLSEPITSTAFHRVHRHEKRYKHILALYLFGFIRQIRLGQKKS